MRQVLRHDLGAKYKKIKKIPYLGNSDRCLLLRQHYARFMLAQLSSGVRVINLDQTWLNTLNFRRRKWRHKGQRHSEAAGSVNPRVAM